MIATALDDLPMPACAQLLGWRPLEADIDKGWIRIAFEGKPEFCNPAGFIQGGFLAAMLDDTMGPAVFIHTKGALYTVTVDLHVTYLGAARPGPIVGEARVVQLGKTIAFIEGQLTDAEGRMLARASTSARLVEAGKALTRA